MQVTLGRIRLIEWMRRKDSNFRPSGYEPDVLPTELPRSELSI